LAHGSGANKLVIPNEERDLPRLIDHTSYQRNPRSVGEILRSAQDDTNMALL